ncbi:hypothetical protein Bpfe_020206 [Biomphalaria pfeifferi]|uniref:Uncharacterized protein n=1 Tax=Biomphalaria pfeifferi TaxID=112525 RepID=A0AAD8B952_BIOPF|nr:hypothetical protein Bpfe_020206 [Biomphalaria pfeifferi]
MLELKASKRKVNEKQTKKRLDMRPTLLNSGSKMFIIKTNLSPRAENFLSVCICVSPLGTRAIEYKQNTEAANREASSEVLHFKEIKNRIFVFQDGWIPAMVYHKSVNRPQSSNSASSAKLMLMALPMMPNTDIKVDRKLPLMSSISGFVSSPISQKKLKDSLNIVLIDIFIQQS